MVRIIILFLFTVSCYSCKKPNRNDVKKCSNFQPEETIESRATIPQGAYGVVTFTEGNCMPGFGASSCFTCPVKRVVRFYEYTTTGEAVYNTPINGFFNSFSTRLIAETETDMHGFYQVTLSPGTYTMVIVENGKLFSRLFDDRGGIHPVTITSGKNKLNFEINYKATY